MTSPVPVLAVLCCMLSVVAVPWNPSDGNVEIDGKDFAREARDPDKPHHKYAGGMHSHLVNQDGKRSHHSNQDNTNSQHAIPDGEHDHQKKHGQIGEHHHKSHNHTNRHKIKEIVEEKKEHERPHPKHTPGAIKDSVNEKRQQYRLPSAEGERLRQSVKNKTIGSVKNVKERVGGGQGIREKLPGGQDLAQLMDGKQTFKDRLTDGHPYTEDIYEDELLESKEPSNEAPGDGGHMDSVEDTPKPKPKSSMKDKVKDAKGDNSKGLVAERRKKFGEAVDPYVSWQREGQHRQGASEVLPQVGAGVGGPEGSDGTADVQEAGPSGQLGDDSAPAGAGIAAGGWIGATTRLLPWMVSLVITLSVPL